MALPVYSGRNVTVAWSGIPFCAFAKENAISLKANSDVTDEEVGMDGKVAISILPDDTGMVVISLQKNSPTNVALSAILQSQKAAGKLYIADMTVNDPSGSAIAWAKDAHLKTQPEINFSTSATGTTYDWTFFCQNLRWLSTPSGIDLSANQLAGATAVLDIASEFLR